MNTDESKAMVRSISFFPGKLFSRVDTFANNLTPSRSTSSVVCEAVADYLAKHDPQPDDATTAAMAQVEAAATRDKTLAADLLQFIRDRNRTRARARRKR